MIKFILALIVMCSVHRIEKTGNLKYAWISFIGILMFAFLIIKEAV